MRAVHASPACRGLAEAQAIAYLWCTAQPKRNSVMASKPLTALGGFLDVINSVIAVASASSDGRKPRSRDLRAIGIDPAQFKEIKRF
jgi:hypothetical protein